MITAGETLRDVEKRSGISKTTIWRYAKKQNAMKQKSTSRKKQKNDRNNLDIITKSQTETMNTAEKNNKDGIDVPLKIERENMKHEENEKDVIVENAEIDEELDGEIESDESDENTDVDDVTVTFKVKEESKEEGEKQTGELVKVFYC